MEVVLDTNFILSCIRKRIDFLEELNKLGFSKVFVPREVLQEMKDLRKNSSLNQDDRIAIDVAQKMLSDKKFKKGKVGGKTVDEGLIAKGREGVFIATLDRAVKREVPNKIVIESAKNSLSVVRD
jgi:rRNA-processing protein FCF1